MGSDQSAYRRGILYLLLGFGLLLTPVLVATFDVGDPDRYEYEAFEVTFHDNGTFDVPVRAGRVDPSVACFEQGETRSCMLEKAIHANGGIRYEHGLPSSFLEHDYHYVYIYGEGFFEPTTTQANDSIEYTLTPVERSRALRFVATDSDRVSTGIRNAITTGEHVTNDELDGTGELVEHEDSYYVVSATASTTSSGERRWFVAVGQWALALVGVLLLLRGQLLRVQAGDPDGWY